MKIVTIAGTRPELIRLSRVIAALDETVNHVLVHTGQNYDYELNEVFFSDLGIRKPDYFLDTDRASLGAMLGSLMVRSEEVLVKEKPDGVLILGDTNSAMASIIARRMRIPVFHMEAGNRSFDLNIPEEVNRRIVDHASDINFVYTEHGRRNLLAEGCSPRHVYLSGSPMTEVLRHYADGIEQSDVLTRLSLVESGYLLASVHREENVDNIASLRSVIGALEHAASEFGLPVLVSTHPRTRKRLEALGDLEALQGVRFHKPFGFFDYVKLQKNALCVLSDSGTISEESAILGFPAVTLRTAMERPEAMDHGAIVLSGIEKDGVLRAIRWATGPGSAVRSVPAEYLVENCSARVVSTVIGLAPLIHRWNGIATQDLQSDAADSDR